MMTILNEEVNVSQAAYTNDNYVHSSFKRKPTLQDDLSRRQENVR